ncbi:unnamed protein product [Schistosoma margrebowiei]|uniref:Uncharacterized protein n=1 Tax=Schistosoma margrebowiei TaxID=48269 RepID=A0A183MSX0_9TREM|nr:unnamed protein product [Schistosoma margrebowiei]
MWDTGRVFQIAAEMRRYNLEVLGISETHWTQVGQQRLASGELLLYSGHEEENASHTQGVSLMLSKQAQKALLKGFCKTIKDGQTKMYNHLMNGLGERNENGERFANLCAFNKLLIRRHHIPTQTHSQKHMDFTGSHHAKPNRPYLHQQNVQEDYRGRKNQERS